MKYTKFKIENFKGIQSVEIDIESLSINKAIALVGLNESGKTTILKAVELIGQHCSFLHEKRKNPFLENGEINKIKPKTTASFWNGETKISCWVKKKDNQKIKLSFIYKFSNDKFSGYDVELDDKQIDFEAQSEQLHDIISSIPQIIFFDDFTLNLPEKIYFSTTQYKNTLDEDMLRVLKKKEAKDKVNREWQIILQDILDSTSDQDNQKPSFQKNIVDYLDGENAGSEDNFRDILNSITKHINKKITNKWLSALNKNSSLKEIVFNCSEIMQGNIQNRHFFFKVISKQGKTFSLSDRSKGCQWFFSFMLFTEFRKYRKNNTLFLIDEPAASLHASIQEKVADALNEICDSNTEAKVIYSTHSPYLIKLDEKELSNIIVTKNNNGGREDRQPEIEIQSFAKAISNRRYSEEIRPIADHINLNIKGIKNQKYTWWQNKKIIEWVKKSIITLDIIDKVKKIYGEST